MDALHQFGGGADVRRPPAPPGVPPAANSVSPAPEETGHGHAEGPADAAHNDWQSAWIDIGGEG